MKVTEAVAARRSIRAFLDQPVSDALLRELLSRSARAPSGGNLQPWRVYVVNGAETTRLVEHVAGYAEPDKPAYAVYPQPLKDPYRGSRFKVGEDMYALLGIPREDKPARLANLARNFEFFGAPAGFFCYIDRDMGPPQWSDLGMFLQTFMLLAQEAGLATCAQEAWSARPGAVTSYVGAPEELMLFCGMAIGYANPDAPVNALETEREPLENWATWVRSGDT
ncbi:MAG: nitroreductase [Pseudomonadota bacterium]